MSEDPRDPSERAVVGVTSCVDTAGGEALPPVVDCCWFCGSDAPTMNVVEVLVVLVAATRVEVAAPLSVDFLDSVMVAEAACFCAHTRKFTFLFACYGLV